MDEGKESRPTRVRKASAKLREAQAGYLSDGAQPPNKRSTKEALDLIETFKSEIESSGDLTPAISKALSSVADIIEAVCSSRGSPADNKTIKDVQAQVDRNLVKQQELEEKLSAMSKKVESLIGKCEVLDEVKGDITEIRAKAFDSNELVEIKNRVEKLSSTTCCNEENSIESHQRARSVVVKGLPYPENMSNYHRGIFLRNQVESLCQFLDVQYSPDDVFYMSKFLVKVRFGSRRAQQEILSRAKRLRFSDWGNVFIRPSLSDKQRVERAENFRRAKAECADRRERGEFVSVRPLPDYVNFDIVPVSQGHRQHRNHLNRQ